MDHIQTPVPRSDGDSIHVWVKAYDGMTLTLPQCNIVAVNHF